jgi:hypothetical protein
VIGFFEQATKVAAIKNKLVNFRIIFLTFLERVQ